MSLMEEQSDDEIFVGKFTIKEIKKNIFRNTLGPYSEHNTFVNIKTEPDASIRIIETHSAPNLLLPPVKEEKATFYSTPGSPALNRESADDSFLKLENKVSELCMDPRTSDDVELNNTLEVINYILNNGPKQNAEHTTPKKDDEKSLTNIQDNVNIITDKEKSLFTHYLFEKQEKSPLKEIKTKCLIEQEKTPNKEIKTKCLIEQEKTPHKEIKTKQQNIEQMQVDFTDSDQYFTPVKMEKMTEVFATPSSSSVKLKPPVFKTPAPPSNKKPVTSAKKTPNRSNPYQHIASPIASYIKNCPQVPLIKDVHPKKPLPGPSSIPKFVKSQPIKLQLQNKENIDLPKVAYKSAKKTVLINVDEEKLPQSQWVKSTLPRPKVVKHEKREMNPLKVRAKQEESFANLSCLQAEVSVCTQKTAFKSNK